MASSSEVGHAKNVSNLETMVSYCTGYGAIYNPSNSDLLLSDLTTLHTESKASVKLVKTTETPFNDVEGKRNLIFKPPKTFINKSSWRSTKLWSISYSNRRCRNNQPQNSR